MLTGAYVTLEDLVAFAHQSERIKLRRKRVRRTKGERISRLRGRGVDFEEVRLYQQGDDIRNIDWNVTARKNEPHTKVFTEERERPTLVVVDQSSTMFLGSQIRLKSVTAAEIAARMAWRILSQRDRVGGLVFGPNGPATTKPFRNRRAVLKFLGDVVDANQSLNIQSISQLDQNSKENEWQDMVTQLGSAAPHHHRVIVISDFRNISEPALDQLLGLSRRNDLRLALVYDDIEKSLPPANEYTVSDGTDKIQFDSSFHPLRNQYELRFKLRIDALKEACLSKQIDFSEYSTLDPLDALSLGTSSAY